MVRMEAAGFDRSFSLVLAECGLRGDKAVYRVVREALAQYLAPARVTAGNLMQRTVTYPAPVPWQPSAPVMPTAEQQAVADETQRVRNEAAVAAAAGNHVNLRPLAVLPTHPEHIRGMEQMVLDIKAMVPDDWPGLAADGDPPRGAYHKWGSPLDPDAGTPATEAEFDSLLMQVLECCTASMTHRVASWMAEFLAARATLAAESAAAAVETRRIEATQAKWSDEQVAAMAAATSSKYSPDGALPLYFFLDKKACGLLNPIVSKGKMPISSDKAPAALRPYMRPGTGSQVIKYDESYMAETPDANGVVRYREADTVARSSKTPTSLETFESTRLFCFTVLGLGLEVTVLHKPWCTLPAVMAYLQMLTVVLAYPSVTAAGFLDYRDTSLRAVAARVNGHGGTLDEAYRLEIANLDVYLDACRQQRALSGLPAFIDVVGDASASAASTPAKASAGAVAGSASGCAGCTERDQRIKRLENQLAQVTNANENKRVLLARWATAHGSLPAASPAGGGAASGGRAPTKWDANKKPKKKK